MKLRDSLRASRYDDSFDDVAEWVKEVDRRRRRRRPTLRATKWAATLAALIMVAAVPVTRPATLGYYLRVTAAGDGERVHSQVRTMPWAGETLAFRSSRDTPEGTVHMLMLAGSRRTLGEVTGWALDLERAGITAVEVLPLRSSISQPLFRAAAQTLFGLSIDLATIPEEHVNARIGAELQRLGGGTVAVVTKQHGLADLVSLPAGNVAGATEIEVPDRSEMVLLVLRNHADGMGTDTLWIALDAAEYAGQSDQRRTELVRSELERIGVRRVDVSFEGGVIRIRARAPPACCLGETGRGIAGSCGTRGEERRVMSEILHSYETQLRGSDGRGYQARACGHGGDDGLWEGWIEFLPMDGGEPLLTPRETTQPNREDLVYWATKLSDPYLDGALLRARRD